MQAKQNTEKGCKDSKIIKTNKNMTRETLNQIAKRNNINLEHYSKVAGFINPNYTKVFILFFDEEGVGTYRMRCNQKTITMNIAPMLKREEDPADYCTKNAGGEWIYEIK